MANEKNLTPFTSENQPENRGRKPGSRNRSTIARQVLEMRGLVPDAVKERLKDIFPDIADTITVEEVMTLIQTGKAIMDSDTNAYKAIMDSAFGAPKQEVETVNRINFIDDI